MQIFLKHFFFFYTSSHINTRQTHTSQNKKHGKRSVSPQRASFLFNGPHSITSQWHEDLTARPGGHLRGFFFCFHSPDSKEASFETELQPSISGGMASVNQRAKTVEVFTFSPLPPLRPRIPSAPWWKGGKMEWPLYSEEPIMEIHYVPASTAAVMMMLTFTPRGPG